MTNISRASLFGKLNHPLYKALESATAFAKLQQHRHVALAHWITYIKDIPAGDTWRILRFFNIDTNILIRDITIYLTALPADADKIEDFDLSISASVERAWIYATLMFNTLSIRSGHLLVGILSSPPLRDELTGISPEFLKLDYELLTDRFDEMVVGSSESNCAATDGRLLASGVTHPTKRDVFISYRKDDSRHVAGRIFDHLEIALGNDRVFKDVNSITAGTPDFHEEIRSQLGTAKIMLIVIGPNWLTVRDSTGRRRIDDRDDFVRLETKWALDSKICLIPVLIDNATMPRATDLPTTIRQLSRCQAFTLRHDPDFRGDMKRLETVCRSHLMRGSDA